MGKVIKAGLMVQIRLIRCQLRLAWCGRGGCLVNGK